jgi:hypothetical protein
VKVEGLIVAGFIALLKAALTMVVNGQFRYLRPAGVTSVTVGRTQVAEVVNVHTKLAAMVLP